ncbi:MAG: protein-L-isoaspartate O-methyltransferase [Patescibacteria group bacterium]|nr:protein-L-isoaspartate O-methyltransferase [Patescibacteria group bacterium]
MYFNLNNKSGFMDLIQQLINTKYLKDPNIIKAFQTIKRKDFILDENEEVAECNAPLAIGFGQTISQPLTVAFMMELLDLKPGQKVLDIGFGSGWASAILAEIVGKTGKVFSIERIPELAEFGISNIRKYGFIKSDRITVKVGDGSKGMPEQAPFDRIHVGAAAFKIPNNLLEQLAIGGKLVIPEGQDTQDIVLVERISKDEYSKKRFPGFSFVPLIEENKSLS